jgi:hypothetical protein
MYTMMHVEEMLRKHKSGLQPLAPINKTCDIGKRIMSELSQSDEKGPAAVSKMQFACPGLVHAGLSRGGGGLEQPLIGVGGFVSRGHHKCGRVDFLFRGACIILFAEHRRHITSE